ncbi:restriction endonuclease subunit S [Desulfitobacterium hafniense]|uniref:restriction endonuclease subunit S n=1 Tax=Desulfitobacterium hafniense TaxID=49338 RepID=UPI0030828114
MYYLLHTERFKKFGSHVGTGLKVFGITFNNLSLFQIKTPSFPEQTAIGNFFRTLDDTITLHKRKLDKLKELKNGYLQKLFPQPGEDVPRVRFAGFNEPWEVRSFENILAPAVASNTLSRAELSYEKGSIKNIHYGDILVRFGVYIDIARDPIPCIANGRIIDYKNKLLQEGDVIFADTAEDETVGKAVEITNISNFQVVSGLHTMAYRPKIKMSPYYLGYYLNSHSFRYQLLPLMQGVKVLSLSRKNLSKTLIRYPAVLSEQSQIGDFLRNLDEQIFTLYNKLGKLKQLKSFYLQKMFI